MTGSGWTPQAFSQHLREIAAEPLELAVTREVDLLTESFRKAAAVVSSFDPTTIRPYGKVEREPGDFTCVLDDSEPVVGSGGRVWTLRPEVRARTLRQLSREGTLAKVVRRAEAGREDPVHQVLKRIVGGRTRDLESCSEAELAAALELAKRLGDDLSGLPAAEDLRRLLGRKRLLSPFYHLANPEHFRGRKHELETLRNYVGVADPKTTSGSIFRRVREIFGFDKRPPLMIFGPGGMGKSALLSHFILEHAALDEERRFPFAYLDFDRPIVNAREPLTLLSEVFAQLGTQYPAVAAECEEVRGRLLPSLGWAFHEVGPRPESSSYALESNMAVRGTSSSDYERGTFIGDLERIFSKVASRKQPLLLVLDTFEEVQHYSRADIPDLVSFLDQVQKAIPRLRVVLAGRTRESTVRIQPLALDPLEPKAAAEILASYGVAEPDAKMIAGKLGGTPLTLRLATDVYLRDGLSAKDLAEITSRDSFFDKVTQERIQGELYRRFLEHIEDNEVRKVAHPGLVLRRVTPDLILNVLRGPCDLEIETIMEARDLFRRLGKQDTLVSWEGASIVHRSDVRRIMIALLKQHKQEQVEAIHRNAVDHYEAFDDVVARAEEIYHRYCLSQPVALIESRWMLGVEDRLRTAVDEVPDALRAHLASWAGAETLDEEEWNQASDRVWERHAATKARQLIAHARYEEALELIGKRARKAWSDASPLFNLEVVALTRLGDLDRAYEVGQEALERMAAAGDLEQEMELLASLGSVLQRTRRSAEAFKMLERAAAIAERRDEPVRALDLLLLALETRREAVAETDRVQALKRLARLSADVNPRQVVSAPVLFWRIANQIEPVRPEQALWIREILSGQDPSIGPDRPQDPDPRVVAERLYELLPRVFSDAEHLERFLAVSLGIRLRQVSHGGHLRSTVYELVHDLARQGRLGELITALEKEFPHADWPGEL